MMQSKLSHSSRDAFCEIIDALLVRRMSQDNKLVAVPGRNIARSSQTAPYGLCDPPQTRIRCMLAKYGSILVKVLQVEGNQCKTTFLA